MSFTDTPDFAAPTRPGQQPDNVIPRFYIRPVKNNFKSNAEGRPIFDDTEYVEIRVPGDRQTIVDTPVNAEHRARWPQFYAHFKNQQEAPLEGTPLTEWPQVTRSQAEELAYFHVKTVEQLAGLTDDQLAKSIPMGGFPIREAAKRFLESAKGSAPTEKLAAELEAQKAKNASLEATVADLVKRLDEMAAQRAEGPAMAAEAPGV